MWWSTLQSCFSSQRAFLTWPGCCCLFPWGTSVRRTAFVSEVQNCFLVLFFPPFIFQTNIYFPNSFSCVNTIQCLMDCGRESDFLRILIHSYLYNSSSSKENTVMIFFQYFNLIILFRFEQTEIILNALKKNYNNDIMYPFILL